MLKSVCSGDLSFDSLSGDIVCLKYVHVSGDS